MRSFKRRVGEIGVVLSVVDVRHLTASDLWMLQSEIGGATDTVDAREE